MRKFTLLVVLVVALALALAACGGNDEPQTTNSPAEQAAANNNTNQSVAAVAGDPERGATLYVSSCVACHGPDGSGVVGLGLSLHPDDSELVRESSDEELVEFIKVGRQPDHPENTTGIAMPPKGGNPALSEEGIYDIVAWMRTLD
jgi:cytochrome c5